MTAWSSDAEDHSATATTVSAPCFIAVETARIDHCGAEPACIHRVFDEILVGQQDADFALAAHLAFAENTTILSIDLEALDFLQLLFATDCLAGLFKNFLGAGVIGECGRRAG